MRLPIGPIRCNLSSKKSASSFGSLTGKFTGDERNIAFVIIKVLRSPRSIMVGFSGLLLHHKDHDWHRNLGRCSRFHPPTYRVKDVISIEVPVWELELPS